jgi:hypothetical protein
VVAYSKAALSKLAESGLDREDATKLGILPKTKNATKQLFPPNNVESLYFTYHDAKGKKRSDVYRVRLLEVQPNAFGGIPEKPLRYLQPPGSPPAVYFPKSVNWSEIVGDPNRPIHITEGELKAACACKHGFDTLGIGGVWSWRSVKDGVTLLPELAAIDWSGRDVVLIFDADAATNSQVTAALAGLVKALSSRGAKPRVAQLPPVNGDPKTGLDDFVVAKGPDALDAVIAEAGVDELSAKLWEFNSQFSFVLSPGLIRDDIRKANYDPNKFTGSLFANVWADRVSTKYTAQGPIERVESVQVAKEWVKWPLRRQYDKLVYSPGQPIVVDGQLNEWPGWGVEPRKGDTTPWKQLLDLLFTDADAGARKWFEQWCLYPLAFPGTKMLTAIGIWSRIQGLGKSLIGVTLGRVYGRENYSTISQRQLDSDFNAWGAKRQFILVDDVSAHDSRAKADILKKLITQETLLVNEKHVPTYELTDHANYYLTSNRLNAFYVEDQDRRFFIHEVTAQKPEPEFYDEYYAWLADGGPAALFWYACNKMDYKGFKPHLPPPLTSSKKEMIDSTRSELDLWLSELAAEPDSKLRCGRIELARDLYTVSEVLNIYDRTRKGKPVAANLMGLRMREYFQPVPGRVLRIDGVTERFFIIRNVDKWSKATKKALIDHVKVTRTTTVEKKKEPNF